MSKTCIIGGGPTGSAEHIFPAAMGGRRTNRGIYCSNHNNAYSDLAAIITEQLNFFNAQLGVVREHSKNTPPVTGVDAATGAAIELKNDKVSFKEPHVHSAVATESGAVVELAVADQKQAEAWVAEQRAKGFHVTLGTEQKQKYQFGTAHFQLKLGGDAEGLRAVGYIAQTFLAHHFPEISRQEELKPFKDYTLNNIGMDFVWWDFDPPELPENAFPFGHRIVVGVNAATGIVYGRVSFFSALDFAMIFGVAEASQSRTVVADIGPLAKSPPHDLKIEAIDSAEYVVSRPNDLRVGLAAAIGSGKAQARCSELMRRIIDYNRANAAKDILAQLAGAASLPQDELPKLIGSIMEKQSQRVLKLLRFFADGFARQAKSELQRQMALRMTQAVAFDASAPNGLTAEATRSLEVASAALVSQIATDFKAGKLDRDRAEMLIEGGAGAAVVGKALCNMLFDARLRPVIRAGFPHERA